VDQISGIGHVEHSGKSESMSVPIGDAPFDPATAVNFGIQVVPE
jgi:hypothetical protein